jgi:hypothetical protein
MLDRFRALTDAEGRRYVITETDGTNGYTSNNHVDHNAHGPSVVTIAKMKPHGMTSSKKDKHSTGCVRRKRDENGWYQFEETKKPETNISGPSVARTGEESRNERATS